MENRVRYLLFFVFCMFLYPLVTEAECSYERISELSKMASNVQLSYTYELKQTIEYDVHITNLTNDLYAMDNEGNAISGNSDVSLHFVYDERKLFSPGEAISYRFYSNDVNCKDEYLMTKYITLPKYNRFALSDECKKYPGFKYCSLWDYTDLDLDTFDSNLKKYLESLNKKSYVIDFNDKSFGFDDLLKNNYIVFLSVFAIISIILIYLFKGKVSR